MLLHFSQSTFSLQNITGLDEKIYTASKSILANQIREFGSSQSLWNKAIWEIEVNFKFNGSNQLLCWSQWYNSSWDCYEGKHDYVRIIKCRWFSTDNLSAFFLFLCTQWLKKTTLG